VKNPEIPSARERPAAPYQHGVSRGVPKTAVFQQAVLPHFDAAYRLARYLTRRSDVAEDIVQEALLRAYRSFEGHRGENVRAWLLAIVRNCFFTWQSQESTRPFCDDQRSRQALVTDGTAEKEIELETPESLLIQHDEGRILRSLIEQIPHPFREVLVLRDIEDMSYREIASITGVPAGTVMSRLARARKLFAAAWNGQEMAAERERRR
jgi:RNA polymerase sigma factor (sigma-70 family)